MLCCGGKNHNQAAKGKKGYIHQGKAYKEFAQPCLIPRGDRVRSCQAMLMKCKISAQSPEYRVPFPRDHYFTGTVCDRYGI